MSEKVYSIHVVAGQPAHYLHIKELRIGMDTRPNWFHRTMQYLFFGFVWKREGNQL